VIIFIRTYFANYRNALDRLSVRIYIILSSIYDCFALGLPLQSMLRVWAKL